jgi:hypothetical protein
LHQNTLKTCLKNLLFTSRITLNQKKALKRTSNTISPSLNISANKFTFVPDPTHDGNPDTRIKSMQKAEEQQGANFSVDRKELKVKNRR